ncbi:ATP-binding cassette domain-containing protein [Nocardioides rotundus]|uniref:ABC transporter ATP-binding protein n=1 Tax=Nocardioides rotundus TaxID=1774216 RepID=UPI001CC16690|nr:ATP-binding cassette domain-containing protein [Nocardioides rotundus]UAL30431.1 ATP-binding cassette domain-containing protein [Nocardioides rotundus]
MTDIVATEGLTKRYGTRTVVEDLNLRIPEGCVYGFLGPNGSGKSTTMKMLLSLIQPTSGEVQVLGQPMTRGTRRQLLAGIGSLIESPPGYAHLTGSENMRIVQRLLGLNRQQIDFAVATVRMQNQMDKKVREYSLGMKQRLGIAMALARQPQLLILDEPTNGLDPAGIDEIRTLLRRLANDGVTVMVSSHLLGEIDKTANMLGILSQGQMIFQGTREQLMAAPTPEPPSPS